MSKPKQAVSSGIAHNALAVGTFIKGNIRAEEDIRIDGVVEGDIDCAGKVVVGPQARINGNITCVNADFLGKIAGQIKVAGTLSLRSTVELTGNAEMKNLEIEAGAVFNGSCSMANS